MIDDTPKTHPRLLSIKEVRQQTGLGRSTIYALLAKGRLHAVKAGARTLVSSDSVAAFVAQLPTAKFVRVEGNTSTASA